METSAYAREILDSRGNPTVEVEMTLKNKDGRKGFGRGMAPSGASTGENEAVELRDGGKPFLGKSVLKAVGNVNNLLAPAIKKELSTYNFTKDNVENYNKAMEIVKKVDELMVKLDGTENFSKLGANATTALSIALIKSLAQMLDIPVYVMVEMISEFTFGKNFVTRNGTLEKPEMPKPRFNVINGGKHAGGELQIQEFMIAPLFDTFKENYRAASETYHILGKLLVKKYGVSARNVGDEGGYAPNLDSAEEALDMLVQAIEEAGYSGKIKLALDAAANSFVVKKKVEPRTNPNEPNSKTEYYYNINNKSQTLKPPISQDDLLDYYMDLLKAYKPLFSLEDPFDEGDWQGFAAIMKKVEGKVQIVGDDLVVTNPRYIRKAVKEKAMDSMIIKINQIGTVLKAINAAAVARKDGIHTVVSHRSGETEDPFIADFSFGISSEFIKSGAPARGERTAKYNQLLRIEEDVARRLNGRS